jgi:DNA-binding response OmpR family regulator
LEGDMNGTPSRTGVRILVVDDDENLRRLVAAYLETEGYQVLQAADGRTALAAVKEQAPQLVVLDLMLPGIDGVEVAKQIRAGSSVPILMLTARGGEDDMLDGFGAGADDYLVKPFSPKVLVARVRAVLRRLGADKSEEETEAPLVIGDLHIDLRGHEVLVTGRPADLTATEFELLRVLSQHPGWVYSREELLESVWGYSYLGDSRLVDVHIANLRRKIGDDSSEPRYIRTVRGAGYKFQTASSEQAPDQP